MHEIRVRWRFISVGVMLGSILLWILVVYGPYSLYIPYVWETLRAPRSETPLKAYEAFENAVKNNDIDLALRYVSRENRSKYRHLLEDPDMRKRQIEGSSNFKELYKVDCAAQEVCRQSAVYTYEYEVREGYYEEISGTRFFVSPSRQFLEMKFIELKNGRWQISEL